MNALMNPRVTFIVPCYNYGRFVAQALDSLLEQTLLDLEIIAIDDASSDETPRVMAGYRHEPRVRVIRHAQRAGHIATYNEGLALARGRYVGILSADDYCLRRDAVERQVALFEQHPRVGMVYSAYAVVDHEHGTVLMQIVPAASDGVRPGLEEFQRLMWGNYVLHSGTLLRAEVQRALGPYDAGLPQSGDWDMWLRASLRHDVGYIAEPLYAYRLHRTNMQAKGIAPREQAEQNLRTLERALALLPEEAPPAIRLAGGAARRHALLQTTWFDLHNGRRRRTWQGAVYALRRAPSLALSGELWKLLARLVLLTVLGPATFRHAVERITRLRLPTRAGSYLSSTDMPTEARG